MANHGKCNVQRDREAGQTLVRHKEGSKAFKGYGSVVKGTTYLMGIVRVI